VIIKRCLELVARQRSRNGHSIFTSVSSRFFSLLGNVTWLTTATSTIERLKRALGIWITSVYQAPLLHIATPGYVFRLQQMGRWVELLSIDALNLGSEDESDDANGQLGKCLCRPCSVRSASG